MPALIMGALIAVARLALWLISYLAIKLLAFFGISFITYKGLDFVVDMVKDRVIGLISNSTVSEFVVISLGLIKFDVCVSILLSAVAMKATINGLNNFTRMVWNHA